MPVSSISIESLNLDFNKEMSNLEAVQETLKIRNNLIDFSDGKDKKMHHLTLFDDLSEETISVTSDLLTSDLSTEKSEPPSFKSIKFTRESSSEIKNASDNCRKSKIEYSFEPSQSFSPEKIFFNIGGNNTNNLLNRLDFKNICQPTTLLEIPSSEQDKESKAVQTDNREINIVNESSQQERSLISDIRNNASLITTYTSHDRGESQINSSCFPNAINAAISDLKEKEYGVSFENEPIPFCNICNSIVAQSENPSEDNKKGSILLNDKDSVPKKVQFREEIETFLYEPKRCVHHPCVILKSPLSTKGLEEGNQNCKTTFTLEATVENFHSYVVGEDGEEIEEMFLENPNILETM
ncbi:hypothetical protein TNCV_464871 [Trichonephila clavipes]|nr:hypothetical protein TNCV_464871 [Trichonephila clavipes]